jgi:hypothetical protein
MEALLGRCDTAWSRPPAAKLPTPRILHLRAPMLRISRESEVPAIGPKGNPVLFRGRVVDRFNRGAKQ